MLLLPDIDQKVQSLEGFPLKIFLDVYKGYHQVQIKHEDEAKTGFHTEKAPFAIKKMPFGLKNTGTNYQRLIDKVFADQIGRNIEVYIRRHGHQES